MKKGTFHDRKLAFFENKSYYGKAERLPVNPMLYDGGRKYEFERISAFAGFPKNATIIELGAGYGKYVLPLLFKGFHVTAVDIGRKLLRTIKNVAKKHKLDKHLKTIQSDFRITEISNEYDVALCISTFHLLAEREDDRRDIFGNLVKSVKPGGSVVVIEPNPFNPLLYILYFFTPQASWSIEKYFLKSTVWNLRRIFEQAGLSRIAIDYVGFLPLRYIRFPGVNLINLIVNRTPILNMLSSFIYIKGTKAKRS